MFVNDTTNFYELIIGIFLLFAVGVIYLISYIKDSIDTKKWRNKVDKTQDTAVRIIGKFEELLQLNNIKIPSEDRNNNDNEACIYGREYYELEDSIIEILSENKR